MGFTTLIKRFLSFYIEIIKRHYIISFLIYLGITIFLGYHAFQIDIKTRFIDLLPENQKSVQDLKKVIDYYGGEGYLIGVVEWNYIHKEPLDLIKMLKEKTEEVKENLRLSIEKEDPEYFSKWFNQEGNDKIDSIISIYKDVKEKIEAIASDKNDKYLNLFIEEMEKNIIPDTEKKLQSL